MRRLLPLVLLAGSPAIAADQTQFDIACHGNRWLTRGGTGESYDLRAHIDLDAKKWCEGDCKVVQKIVSVSASEILLTDDSTFNPKVDITREVTFDREEKVYKYHFVQTRPEQHYLGILANCTIEPFTPFPGTAPVAPPPASPAN